MVMTEPTKDGRFGEFGGRFVPESLVAPCEELETAFREAWADPGFRAELAELNRSYAGRPSIMTECFRLSEDEDHDVCFRQPRTEAELDACLEARDGVGEGPLSVAGHTGDADDLARADLE